MLMMAPCLLTDARMITGSAAAGQSASQWHTYMLSLLSSGLWYIQHARPEVYNQWPPIREILHEQHQSCSHLLTNQYSLISISSRHGHRPEHHNYFLR